MRAWLDDLLQGSTFLQALPIELVYGTAMLLAAFAGIGQVPAAGFRLPPPGAGIDPSQAVGRAPLAFSFDNPNGCGVAPPHTSPSFLLRLPKLKT